ncbi:MAG: prolyl oligopeptidase family serine peptidase [Gemmatimonadota bacterium]
MRRLLAAIVLLAPLGLETQSPRLQPFQPVDALDLVTWSVADLSADGEWLLATTTTRRAGLGVDYRRDADPSYIRPAALSLWLIELRSGAHRQVFADARNLRSPVFSPDGRSFALLQREAGGDRFVPVVVDRSTMRSRVFATPAGRYVAENSDVRWTNDGKRLIVALRTDEWKKAVAAEFARMTAGPIFVQDSREPFLAWDALRRRGNVRSVASIDVATGTASELIPESMIASYALSADDSIVTYQQDITKKTDYDVIFGTENRLMAQRVAGGPPQELQATLRNTSVSWAPNGRSYAYTRDGRVSLTSIGGTPRQIAGPDTARQVAAAADTSAEAREARANQRFSVVRWSPRGDALLLSSRQGLWLTDATSGERIQMLATSDSSPTAPRYQTVAWSDDGRFVYLTYAARTQWERGLVRYDRTDRTLRDLVRDGRMYQGFRLAKNGSVAVFASADGNRPSELYTAGADLRDPRRLTNTGAALADRALARTRLVSYHDIDGKTRYGVIYMPADFVEGRKYPTLFNIYEDFFDDTYDATINVLTGNGYVVVKPSVAFETGFPGEAWLKGVTSAANKMIEMGIADSSRLGVFGTSYGGYATNLLITQTNRFKAAVNISGKVDIISFYTDSPRLGVRNTHAAEKSQDRIGATLWEQPQKYIAHSAVMFADRITTPLLLVTGEQDSNVPAGNTREMYYALRRLNRDVLWVNYMNSGHGTPGTNAAEFIDYHDRLLGFFGKHLKGESGERVVEATSLLNEPLYRPSQPPEARARMLAQLATARAALERTPADADSLIWLGRRTAYLGRYNEAIDIFSDGIARHPADPRMYRHRGHRYITIRRFDLAIRDFEKAVSLVRGKADVVEPDGQPNARGIPTSTLQSNIWYHLGLAYYLSADFNGALRAYREHLRLRNNPDGLVAMSHWMYMALRRLGRDAEAARVLQPITKELDVIENGNYHKLLLMYKGEVSPSDVLTNFGAEGSLEDVTVAYGVGNWHLYNGRRDEARSIFDRIVSARGQWAAFGYISAEAEVKRLASAPVATPAPAAGGRR